MTLVERNTNAIREKQSKTFICTAIRFVCFLYGNYGGPLVSNYTGPLSLYFATYDCQVVDEIEIPFSVLESS